MYQHGNSVLLMHCFGTLNTLVPGFYISTLETYGNNLQVKDQLCRDNSVNYRHDKV